MPSVVDFLADGSDKRIIAELPDGKRSPSPLVAKIGPPSSNLIGFHPDGLGEVTPTRLASRETPSSLAARLH